MSRVCRRNLIAAVLLSAAAGLSLVQAASAAEIYKWVDENGTTHYSNVKPEGVKVDLIPEDNISVIPGSRIGAEAARAAERESQTSGAASESDVLTQAEALAEARLQQRRERMLQYCQRNNGVDCEREVDTELRAEGLMQGHRIVPPPVRVIPAPPATGESPGTPGSRLR
jgi:hypothetical protein